ncbi:2,3-bisphosphoglycerate-independent phosphoglycerate mutase [Kordiimonas aquimaris]|uniref:2,3-bisphosphoglycerate-independent phosphoglycerate mutase n=1 Tax=Kordiimonas aquimaris TaxID=707591 RepID=UPI0021D17562|nr:2,3-bisphosphoglycerate-independent phosphoglycerate mutase [Kordiimonas aquimaris]
MNSNSVEVKKPVVLCILDGWGYSDDIAHNAIKQANTPTYDRLWDTCPRAWLATSGLAVGLPDGQMGNSEVGHMNLGGGRVVLQDLPRIDTAIADGSLANNPALVAYIEKLKLSNGTAHLMGLLSPGGVHSHQNHMVALANIITGAGVPVSIHAFLDGRDTPPRSAIAFIEAFEGKINDPSLAKIASVSGRYYAMDRDARWDRVEKAYDSIMGNETHKASSAIAAVEHGYAHDLNDEFILPTIIGEYTGMKDGDGLLMANFRADRAREILTAFLDPNFDGFARKHLHNFSAAAGMSEYSEALSTFHSVLFPSAALKNSLGEVLANHGIPQLRIAETEKYAHVTFFFNGGIEPVFEGEDRILVPSPDVATYDLKPEMSAHEVTDKLVDAITSGKYGTIIVNYANPDMVGHTGVMSAAIKAVETIDGCLARLETAAKEASAALLVTADHGNVEMMTDNETGQPHTAHTSFDVPIIMVNDTRKIENGCLADVAPTILSIMGIAQPEEMTGNNLLNP